MIIRAIVIPLPIKIKKIPPMIHHQVWNTKLNRETSFLIKSNNPIHSQGNQKFIVDSLSSSKFTP